MGAFRAGTRFCWPPTGGYCGILRGCRRGFRVAAVADGLGMLQIPLRTSCCLLTLAGQRGVSAGGGGSWKAGELLVAGQADVECQPWLQLGCGGAREGEASMASCG